MAFRVPKIGVLAEACSCGVVIPRADYDADDRRCRRCKISKPEARRRAYFMPPLQQKNPDKKIKLRKCCMCRAEVLASDFERPDGKSDSRCSRCRIKQKSKKRNKRKEKINFGQPTPSIIASIKPKKAKPPSRRGFSGDCYLSRNNNLKIIGLFPYSKYLKSDLWKSIRRRVCAQKKKECVLCGNRAKALHHNRYHLDDLEGTTIEHIHPICRDCHDFIEFGKGERKNTLMESRACFNRMIEYKGQPL